MPREVTLFTDDGQWAAVVTAWEARYVLYHDLGVRVRVYRLGVPDTWGSELGPWSKFGPFGGPWKAYGPWSAWGPWRVDTHGPWRSHKKLRDCGPWGAVLPRSWVETRAKSIAIETRYRGAKGRGEVTRKLSAGRASFLRLSESAFGRALVLRDDEHKPVPIESIRSTVDITLVDGVSLKGHVTTEAEEPER